MYLSGAKTNMAQEICKPLSRQPINSFWARFFRPFKTEWDSLSMINSETM